MTWAIRAGLLTMAMKASGSTARSRAIEPLRTVVTLPRVRSVMTTAHSTPKTPNARKLQRQP